MFLEQPLTVRGYRDSDYPEAFDLYARAFHLMRLTIGCFPNSTVGSPSILQRSQWNDTRDTRVVCEYGGQLAGYAHIEGNEISSISVKPELQGRGIGGMFLKTLINGIIEKGYDEVILFCLRGNRASHLYERTGFITECFETYAIIRK